MIKMKTFDRNGQLLCELQAKAFELSVDQTQMSSAVFIRRFMNSQAAKRLDDGSILTSNILPVDLLDLLEEQYGPSQYGSRQYSHDELFWIGYVYRYFAYTYEKSSSYVYKIVKPQELWELFPAYHTLDPSQAIERILEAHHFQNAKNELDRQYEIFRHIRLNYRHT